MYLTKGQLARLHNVCTNTISKRCDEMMATGKYRHAFKQVARKLIVDADAFDEFLQERAISEWEKKHEWKQ